MPRTARPFKLDGLAAGTWRAGLDRLLLGVTMTEDDQRLFEGVLPLDDVESGAIDLAGRFAELVERLRAALDALSDAEDDRRLGGLRSPTAADALTATTERDAWQRPSSQRLLDDVVEEATVGGAVNTTHDRAAGAARAARANACRAGPRARTSAPAT